jgi:hypothetical protein
MAIAPLTSPSSAPRFAALSKGSARLVAILVAVFLVAGCKSTAVTGGWGNQADPAGRPAGSGMDRGGSGGGGY